MADNEPKTPDLITVERRRAAIYAPPSIDDPWLMVIFKPGQPPDARPFASQEEAVKALIAAEMAFLHEEVEKERRAEGN